jgi:hypothetical protein
MIPAMWTARRDNPGPAKTLRLRFYARDECLSCAEFLKALAEDASFRELIQKEVRADPTDFQTYFQPGVEVVSFENLGADALLVVPCPISNSANYSHNGVFHRSAPHSQQHAFWITVAQAVLTRIGSQPLWLSTAGGGVD